MSASTRTSIQNGTVERVSRKRGPDVWMYRFRQTDPATGKRVQKKIILGTVHELKSKSAAKKAAEPHRAKINQGRSATRHVLTLGDLWEAFKTDNEAGLYAVIGDKEAGRSPSTIKSYHDYYQFYLLPKWAKTPVVQMTTDAIRSWLHRDLKGKDGSLLAGGTRHQIRQKLSPVLEYAFDKGWIDRNPCKSKMLKTQAKRQEKPTVLTREQCAALIEGIEHPQMKLAILLMTTLGLRRSEARGLRYGDFDFENRELTLKRGKVGKLETPMKTELSRDTSLPVAKELCDYIQAYRLTRPYQAVSDYLLATEETQGKEPLWITSAKYDQYVRPVAAALGINGKITTHTSRRSFASGLVAADVPLDAARELMRHMSIETTMRLYAQAREDRKRGGIEAMNLLKAPTSTEAVATVGCNV